jgi:tetratricopeptide (TPR) repeat protein
MIGNTGVDDIVEPRAPAGLSLAPDATAPLVADYVRRLATGDAAAARQGLLDALAAREERDWLECGRALVLRRDLDGAAAVFAAASDRFPDSADAQQALAGVHWQTGQPARAEPILRALLAAHPGHVAATFLLAKILKEQGRTGAAEAVVRALFAYAPQPIGTTIQAIELLDDAGRKQAAAELCESEIARGSTDARLHAYSAMLHLQLGDFARVRERYTYALAHDERALDWQAANGLAAAQRYKEASHPDFALFQRCLERPGLGDRARASLLFALGKAHDDIGDFAQAAGYFREANRVVASFAEWPRKNFRRMVAARLDAKPLAGRSALAPDFVPVFIVGMPRSGSTLVAELLSRHPDVRQRGELPWLPVVAERLSANARPTAEALGRLASTYLAQLRLDDALARFYLDKQPLNFLHLDAIAALLPNARVIYCERGERDTALSIWTQYFAGAEHNFAYDFADIATVMQACPRLIASARKRGAPPIHTVRYERLVTATDECLGELADWLGLGELDATARDGSTRAISTASLWQVRQPIYTRSVGRWRAYAPHVPELMRFPE